MSLLSSLLFLSPLSFLLPENHCWELHQAGVWRRMIPPLKLSVTHLMDFSTRGVDMRLFVRALSMLLLCAAPLLKRRAAAVAAVFIFSFLAQISGGHCNCNHPGEQPTTSLSCVLLFLSCHFSLIGAPCHPQQELWQGWRRQGQVTGYQGVLDAHSQAALQGS